MTTVVAPTASPPALRTERPRWRDPRLWVGVVLVVGSALVGGRTFAAADRTVSVWSAAHDIRAGAEVTASDFTVSRVHFDQGDQRDRYLPSDSELPNTARAAYDVGKGELVPRSALDRDPMISPQLPLGVASVDMPSDLKAGDHVAVWAVPPDGDGRRLVTVVFDDVQVVDVAGVGDVSAGRQVLLRLDGVDEVDIALRALSGHRPVLVRIGA